MMDGNSPKIYAGNWLSVSNDGWRWSRNVNLKDKAGAKHIIEDLQETFGKENVTAGHAFNESSMKPAEIIGQCGIYVRDVEQQVEEANKLLDDPEAVAAWLGV